VTRLITRLDRLSRLTDLQDVFAHPVFLTTEGNGTYGNRTVPVGQRLPAAFTRTV